MLKLPTAMRTIIYASLASVGAASFYGVIGLSSSRGTHMSLEVIVWVLAVSMTVFPVALASSLLATLVERSPISAKSLPTLSVLAAVPWVSAVIFIAYMSTMSPNEL